MLGDTGSEHLNPGPVDRRGLVVGTTPPHHDEPAVPSLRRQHRRRSRLADSGLTDEDHEVTVATLGGGEVG